MFQERQKIKPANHIDGRFYPEHRTSGGYEAVAYYRRKDAKAVGFIRKPHGEFYGQNDFRVTIFKTEADCQIICDQLNDTGISDV